MAVRVQDIAKKLNISPATVSLALNHRKGVSEKLRNTILKTADDMGYKKTAAVHTPSQDTIQLAIFKQAGTQDLDHSFFAKMMEGIDSVISHSVYRLSVTYLSNDENIPAKLLDMKKTGTAGFILLATELNHSHIKAFLNLSLPPMVVLDGYFEELPMDFITINNVQGAFLAVSYLHSLGYNRIGYLTGKVRIVNFTERHEGLNKAFKKLGLEKRPQDTLPLSPSLTGAHQDMLDYIDEQPDLPSAFFADNDILAAGAVQAFKQRGYRIPEDVSIVGFDDIPLCRLLDPELTTVSVPKERLGVLAAERLISRIEGDTSEHIKIEVGTQMVVRGSTKRLPSP